MFHVGQKVVFGRPNGEQTPGVITKINRKSIKIRQSGSRGSQRVRPDGTVWTVHPSMVRAADPVLNLSQGDTNVTQSIDHDTVSRTRTFKVGQKVSWVGRNGINRTGVVRRVNNKTISVDEDGRTDGGYWRVPPSMLRLV